MPVSAFVLVDVTGDHTKSAYKTMTRLEGVKAVYTVSGPYDLIAHVEVESLEQLSELILSRIRSVDGVTKTTSAIVLNL
jgi:DNA-binding Lrp family transcriptional regulator